MKLLMFFANFLLPLMIFINGSLFIVYICYLSYINSVPINIFGSVCFLVTFVLCFALFIIDIKRQRDENKFLSNL